MQTVIHLSRVFSFFFFFLFGFTEAQSSQPRVSKPFPGEAVNRPSGTACWSRGRIARGRTPRSSGRWCWTRKRVCRCSPSSPKGNRRGVLAAIARLKTATCSRPWTNTGMRTVSNVPAVTAAWGRWAPPSTRKPTSSSVAGTT